MKTQDRVHGEGIEVEEDEELEIDPLTIWCENKLTLKYLGNGKKDYN